MMTRHFATLYQRLGALLVFAALLATACGSGVTQTATEREVQQEVAVEVSAPPTETTHQYGASLEEFGDTVRETEAAQASSTAREPVETQRAASDATTIAWDDLVPPDETAEAVFARFETRLEEVEVGSPEATALYQEMQAEFDPAAVNGDLDGQKIWLAGFVAPLTYDGDIVTEFLLVPSFGACIHVPPPPPNQTIMVTVDKDDGLTTEEAWGAVWVEGTMTLASASTDLAEASYTITSATSGVYNDF